MDAVVSRCMGGEGLKRCGGVEAWREGEKRRGLPGRTHWEKS